MSDLPIIYTATCEICRWPNGRNTLRCRSERDRDNWAEDHRIEREHKATLGTYRGNMIVLPKEEA